ncbi:MAG: ATP-binding protein [Proteobacteria bacterium]|nr:ATP-binding protein [Pseudomonadota bacterium]MBU1610937.1 ATP-binding protein [Pseudomonadota bacterium]
MDTLRTPATLAQLDTIQTFVLECARTAKAPPDLDGKLGLVLEELAVNVFNHAYGKDEGELEVSCDVLPMVQGRCFCVTLKDWGLAFDPLATAAPDTTLDVEQRPIGGLGILLVVNMSDSISYERQGDTNVLRVCFQLPE